MCSLLFLSHLNLTPPRHLLWTQNLYLQLPLLDGWKAIIIYVLKQTNTLFLKIRYLPLLQISANVDTSPPALQACTWESCSTPSSPTFSIISTQRSIFLYFQNLSKPHILHFHYQIPSHTTVMLLSWLPEPSKWSLTHTLSNPVNIQWQEWSFQCVMAAAPNS